MSEDNNSHDADAELDEEPANTPDPAADDGSAPEGGSPAGQTEPSPQGGDPSADAQSPGQGGNPSGQSRDGPTVNMGMMYGGVEVTGASDDELDDVTEAATELMSNLAEEFKGIQSAMDDDSASGSGDDPHRHCQ